MKIWAAFWIPQILSSLVTWNKVIKAETFVFYISAYVWSYSTTKTVTYNRAKLAIIANAEN